MHSEFGEAEPRAGNYFSLTRTATYSFLAALPLFLAYEVLILVVNQGTEMPIRVGADLWIKQAMAAMGATGVFSVGVAVLLIGTAIFVRERRKRLPIHGSYFMAMIGESLMYAILVAFLVSTVVGLVFPRAASVSPGISGAGLQPLGTLNMLVLSIGAGLYEELVFRVLLVGGLFWTFRNFSADQNSAYIVAAVIGAIAFSAVHYIGPLGDAFQMSSFFFRFLFGLALNALFLVRGFGVAAWTHALYDILVVSQIIG